MYMYMYVHLYGCVFLVSGVSSMFIIYYYFGNMVALGPRTGLKDMQTYVKFKKASVSEYAEKR